MPTRLALALLLLALVSTSGYAKELGQPFHVGNWSGDAYSDDQTGLFSHCAAGVSYKDGTYLVVSVARNFGWELGLANLPFTIPQQGLVQASIKFDNVGPYQLSAKIKNNGTSPFFDLLMPNNDVAISAFRAARGLSVTIYGRILNFNLTSTRELLPALSTCVSSNIQAAQPPSVENAPPKAPSKSEPNAEAIAAREKLLSDAGKEYNACIQSNMKEIVPYSNESAEIIAQVIITKCEDSLNHFTELSMALFGVSKSEAEKSVNDALDAKKKTIVADIVTFRAALTKALSEQKGNDETKVKDKEGQGL